MLTAVKPYPWRCATCRERSLQPATIRYEVNVDHDGRGYAIAIPDLDVVRCQKCGAVVLNDAANERVSNALRAAAGLLLPREIREKREALGLTQKQLARFLDVSDSTLSRWETGAQIQQRVMDRFLRAFFAVPEVRHFLGTEHGSFSVQ